MKNKHFPLSALKKKQISQSSLTMYFVRTLFAVLMTAAAILLFTRLSVNVYAEEINGGTYFASSLKSKAADIKFKSSATIIMDQDLEKTSLIGADITITGTKTLSVKGSDATIQADAFRIENGAAVSLTVSSKKTTSFPFCLIAKSVTISNGELEINNGVDGGIYSYEGLTVDKGILKITSTSDPAVYTNFANSAVTIKNTEIDLKTGDDAAINSEIVQISNSSGSIYSHNSHGIYSRKRTSLKSSDLTIHGKNAAVASDETIELDNSIYVKSPEHTKLSAAMVNGLHFNCVLCNSDGSPAASVLLARRSLTAPLCTISSIADQACTGAAVEPAISVFWEGTELKEGTDYTVTYRDNIQPGTAAATIKGIGNYTDSADIVFRITGLAPGKKAKVSGQTYKILNSTSAAFIKAKNKKSVTVPASVTIQDRIYAVTQINAKAFKAAKIRTVTIGKNVTTIKANAFKGSSVSRLIIKTKLLKKKNVKNALKGSKIETAQIKAGKKSTIKKVRKAYMKFFTKKVLGRNILLE